MANLTTISRPYVKAILSLAHNAQDYARWSEMLQYLSLVVQDPSAQRIIRNLALPAAQKADFINDLKPNVLDQDGKNLVKVLATSKRLEILPAMATLYEKMRQQIENQVVLDVTLADPLQTDFQSQLQQELAADFAHAKTETHYALEPALIAGGKIKIGDRVVENSVRSRLAALYNDLIR